MKIRQLSVPKEAKEYAQDLAGCSYLGYVSVFHVYDASIGDGTEVYSLMRTSKLDKKKYHRFFDTGRGNERVAAKYIGPTTLAYCCPS
jgi:hypothetical protein